MVRALKLHIGAKIYLIFSAIASVQLKIGKAGEILVVWSKCCPILFYLLTFNKLCN